MQVEYKVDNDEIVQVEDKVDNDEIMQVDQGW